MLLTAYTEAETTDFLRRQVPVLLARLEADQLPAWGLMSAQHMVEHLTGAVRLSMRHYPMPPPAPSAALEHLRASLDTDAPFFRNRLNPACQLFPAGSGSLRWQERRPSC
jgi:hypothetical protein